MATLRGNLLVLDLYVGITNWWDVTSNCGWEEAHHFSERTKIWGGSSVRILHKASLFPNTVFWLERATKTWLGFDSTWFQPRSGPFWFKSMCLEHSLKLMRWAFERALPASQDLPRRKVKIVISVSRHRTVHLRSQVLPVSVCSRGFRAAHESASRGSLGWFHSDGLCGEEAAASIIKGRNSFVLLLLRFPLVSLSRTKSAFLRLCRILGFGRFWYFRYSAHSRLGLDVSYVPDQQDGKTVWFLENAK